MQIKVKNTKIHVVIPPGSSMYHDITVVEAKLVLVPAKEDALLTFNQYRGEYYIIPNKGDRLKMPCSYLKPILISETEYCVGGQDKYLDNQNTICNLPYASTLATTDTGKKILALPEHFTSEQLNMIVEGKLKDGDKVYVECIYKGDYDEYLGHGDKDARIKSPLSIYPIEEKLYTKDQMKRFEQNVR